MAEGVRKRHSKGCRARTGGRCNCNAGYEAWVFSKRDGRKIRKTFARESEAKTWRADALAALVRGGLRAARPVTVEEAWDRWYRGALDGSIRNRSGDRFKPSALRSYERAMRLRILPEFGTRKIPDVQQADLQDFADELMAAGKYPSTIKVTFLPLRAVFGRAVAHGQLVVNPCDGLKLPAVRGGRERVASPQEAERLVGAAPREDRAIWATALYAGLRRGELLALRAEDVDLASGVIRVERGWDEKEGEIELKTRAGRRRVPVPPILRDALANHRMAVPRSGSALIFGRSESLPFYPKSLQERADRQWSGAGLERITLHECRHTFASLMIAAGVNAKALQTFMGHSSIQVTFDLYGHLMPGSEAEAAALLDAYLAAQRANAEDAARGADVPDDGLTGAPAGAQVAHEIL